MSPAAAHWFNRGHWLEWVVRVPADGPYHLLVRCCAAGAVRRSVSLDGQPLPTQRFGATGGFGGGTATDWVHARIRGEDEAPLVLQLAKGDHTVRLEAPGGDAGMNLDHLALAPVK